MSEVKVYRIIGKIRKPNFRTNFQKEIRALKPEDAIEMVYKNLGSKHRVKRFQIVIEDIKEVAAEGSKTAEASGKDKDKVGEK